MSLVAFGSLSGSIMITIFNKGITGGARNGAARVAWFLMGVAVGLYAYGSIGGLVYAFNAGDISARSSRGASVRFHRSEHPLWFWFTFFELSLATGVITFLSLACFWKAFKRG